MHHRRAMAISSAVVLFATLVAGCANDTSEPSSPTASVEVADTTATDISVLNDADVEFAQGMIAHHEQALEMAQVALDPVVEASATVVDLATRIQAAQEPEIELMTAWLTDAGRPLTMDTSGGHHMESMDGMMSSEQMDALNAASGPEFDRLWLELMIEHHQGAVSQAQTVKSSGSNPAVLALADQIIADQEAEIAEMQALLDVGR